jgi:hypothetical protein
MEKTISITIKGISPLLCNNPTSMKPSGAVAPKKGGITLQSPEEEAFGRLYVVDGEFCFPSNGIRKALITAASSWASPTGKKRGTLKGSIAHIRSEPEFCAIRNGKKPVKTYEIDARRAVIQRNGVTRNRPRFPNWELTVDLVYDDALLPGNPAVIKKLFADVLGDAGSRLGIGDYRPEKSGWFGRFLVVE